MRRSIRAEELKVGMYIRSNGYIPRVVGVTRVKLSGASLVLNGVTIPVPDTDTVTVTLHDDVAGEWSVTYRPDETVVVGI